MRQMIWKQDVALQNHAAISAKLLPFAVKPLARDVKALEEQEGDECRRELVLPGPWESSEEET